MDSSTRETSPHPVLSLVPQHGQQLYRHIYLGCKEEDNVHKNFELLFTTLAILTIELANEEVVVDLIRLTVALQVTAACQVVCLLRKTRDKHLLHVGSLLLAKPQYFVS